MKIKNIQIISNEGKKLHDVSFHLNGVSIIYANIEKQEDTAETINSLGKTLFLKFVDFLYGCNHDKNFFKPQIYDFVIQGTLINENGKSFSVSRTINKNSENYINGSQYKLEEYKKILGLRRDYLDKQFFLEGKNSLISTRPSITESDVVSFLELLEFNNIVSFVKELYKINESIRTLNSFRLRVEKSYKSSNKTKDLKEDIYLTNQRIDELTRDIKRVSESIRRLDLSEVKQDVYTRYTDLNIYCKDLYDKISGKTIEIKNLKKFLKSTTGDIVTANHVQVLFKKAKKEVNSLIIKRLEEVEGFHNKVYNERLAYLNSQLDKLNLEKNKLEGELKSSDDELKYLGDIISKNEAYQEAIKLYANYNKELNDLKFRQGALSESENIYKQIEKDKKELDDCYEETKLIFESDYSKLLGVYRDFIYEVVQKLYTEVVKAYFDIEIKKVNGKRKNPIEITLNLTGDTGEGVGTVRRLLIDILIFKMNKLLDILVLDSSCFNGVDPRQTYNSITVINEICKENEKQSIIALNKYQLPYNDDVNKFIKETTILELSENQKL